MKWPKLLVLPVVLMMLLAGCDKKASNATVNMFDQATKQAVAVATQYNGQVENVVGSDDIISAVVDVSKSFDLLSLGCQNFNDALAAKKTLSENSAQRIDETKNTIETLRRIVVQTNAKLTAKDPAQAPTIEIWKVQVVEKLDALILTFSRLNESVQADLATAKQQAK